MCNSACFSTHMVVINNYELMNEWPITAINHRWMGVVCIIMSGNCTLTGEIKGLTKAQETEDISTLQMVSQTYHPVIIILYLWLWNQGCLTSELNRWDRKL